MPNLTTSYHLLCYHYLSLGSPRSRSWDKKSIASSLFWRWFREKPVGERTGDRDRKKAKGVFKQVSTMSKELNPARDSGSQCRLHAQSYPTTGLRDLGHLAGLTHCVKAGGRGTGSSGAFCLSIVISYLSLMLVWYNNILSNAVKPAWLTPSHYSITQMALLRKDISDNHT